MNSFLFYDYETFGTSPSHDRIAQFAAIRTDEDFNIIEKPINILCKQYNDYIPSPEAILITKLTPEYCNQNGLDEHLFAAKIHEAFSTPNTCILGYNSIRFDDEMTRYLFYRNFYDPYAYSWMNGNSRWDLIDIVRATYALRPKGINWPEREGKKSFKLEDLSQANHLNHEKAHDALSDVYATIGMAKLLQSSQPKLFNYFFQRRKANDLIPYIEDNFLKPLVHISGMFGESRANMSVITPICYHPWNKKAIICVDLMGDINEIINYPSKEIEKQLYTPSSELSKDRSRPPIKLIHLNKCPVLAPVNTLKNAENLQGIDLDIALNHLANLHNHIGSIRDKLASIYQEKPTFDPNDNSLLHNVESMLYSGFFNNHDKQIVEKIPQYSEEDFINQTIHFEDVRLTPLLFLYRAKNFPNSLSREEKNQWNQYAKEKRHSLHLKYQPIFKALCQDYIADQDRYQLLQSCAYLYE